MTRVDPPLAADETPMLLAWLEFQRETMVAKLEGLSPEQARFVPAPGANSLLGLITHLANVERWWFVECFLNDTRTLPAWADPDDEDWDFHPPANLSIDDAVAAYRANWERSNAIALETTLDATVAHPHPKLAGTTMRWILVHMIEETARHAGHADITRELVDGSTGL